MRNILIVDGYNAIYQISELQSKISRSLESARAGLANLIFTWNRTHPAYDCLIIFDGRDPLTVNMSKTIIGGIHCFFTRTKVEADDEIIRQVREQKCVASNITVVSNDNYVRNNCKAHGAVVQPTSYFAASQRRNPTGRGQVSSSNEKTLDPKSASEINKELRQRYGL